MMHNTFLKNVLFSHKALWLTLILLALSLFTFGVSNAAPAAQEALPQQPYLPLQMAIQAASAVILKGDGAGPHTIGSSVGKAFTAASMRRATADIAATVAENPAVAGLRDMDERILILAGGLPIEIDGQVVAGIGVGGAPGGDLDAACAQAGIDEIVGAGN